MSWQKNEMINKKRILIVAPYGFNDRMTNYIEFVSGRLLARSGWSVTAITMSENNKNSINNICGINVYHYKNILYGIIDLLNIILFFRPKIIHIHNLRNNRLGIITAIFARIFFIHYVFTEYGLLHDHYLTDDREDPLNNTIHTERVICNITQLIKKIIPNGNCTRVFFPFPIPYPLSPTLPCSVTPNMPPAPTRLIDRYLVAHNRSDVGGRIFSIG